MSTTFDYPCASIPKCPKQITSATTNLSIIAAPQQASESDKSSRYLADRLYVESSRIERSLRKDFAIDDDDAPRTPKELVDRIASGKYILPTKKWEDSDEDDGEFWGLRDVFYGIRWRDPSKPADKAGYEAAMKLQNEACQTARDIIAVKSADDGLIALNEFKAKKFN